MGNEEFLRLCKAKVAEYTNSHMDKTDGKQITVQDVYVVWSCKTLQNSKALLSTTVPDGMYYELTYNGDKHELYFDAYKKFQNIFFKVYLRRRNGGEVRNMKIRVIHDFYDKENDLELRKVGEEYEVTEERGRYLVDFRVAKEIIDQEGGDPESPVEA